MDNKPLRSFLEIPYVELETMNLSAKKKRKDNVNEKELKEFYLNYLIKEKRLKAVTIGFSDLEGRFHMIDYDKKFFLDSYDNMTFDGSSIRGFSRQAESDLRLGIDWGAFWWLPSDVFGSGKVLVMGKINGQDEKP
ncbi:MAG: glutamine synthetase beta-grasp domain-containing protein, partial [Patescibacteria group bacterium]